MMNTQVFSDIANILERDSKSTTYKFALLRGVIEIAQENSPFIDRKEDRFHIPFGLLVYKFILYYYPLFEEDMEVPQIGGDSNLAFQNDLIGLIKAYKLRGELSAFNKDIRGVGIDENTSTEFMKLARKVATTIKNMPMKHIGYSLSGEYYSIFQPEESGSLRKKGRVDLKYLIDHMGTFSIPADYYEAFKILGSFISGRDSILFKWADFSVKASKKSLPMQAVLSKMLNEPVNERDVIQAKRYYEELIRAKGYLHCVWTGRELKNSYHVDHMIPYSVWGNNDLWNLLPALDAVNGKKRDKIPSPDLIARRRDTIVECWEGLSERHEERFKRELQVALIGKDQTEYWQDKAIEQLQASCQYLIKQRGFQEWHG